MKLVLDANILFSALIKESHIRHFLLLSENDFYMPGFVLEEVRDHLRELEEKSALPARRIFEVLEEIITLSKIKIIPLSDFKKREKEAERFSPDPDDVPYLALALHLGCALWSNDKRLKEQNQVRVYDTEEILGGKF